MDKSSGQTVGEVRSRGPRTDQSAPTRERLMTAAAELVAELGWGRVTTRAVAERAGLPHGTVSYHFRGKQELLTEAALHAFQQAVPAESFAALDTVEALIDMIAAELETARTGDPMLPRLMLETMREAERDAQLRDRMGALMSGYRQLMVDAVRADQQRGELAADLDPAAIGTLLGAVGDGLLMHALLDPDLDVTASLRALRHLLSRSS
jgi:AcrR family transcriptional regulator